MTIHMVRVLIGAGNRPVQQIETQLQAWMDANPEWNDDQVPHELTERNTDPVSGGQTYYAMEVRFLPASSKANIQQALEGRLQGQTDWYRLGYHNCTHREVDGSDGPCSWDDVAEWTANGTSIPADVPNIL